MADEGPGGVGEGLKVAPAKGDGPSDGVPERNDLDSLGKARQGQAVHQGVSHVLSDHGEDRVVICHLEADVRREPGLCKGLQGNAVLSLIEENVGERG